MNLRALHVAVLLLAISAPAELVLADDPWPAPPRALGAPSRAGTSAGPTASRELGARLALWRDRPAPVTRRRAASDLEEAVLGSSPALLRVPGVRDVRAGRHAGLPALLVLVEPGVSAVALEGLLQGQVRFPVVVLDAGPGALTSR